MKQALTRVFQYYGPILDVIAKSSLKRKGQAFIVFADQTSATTAMTTYCGWTRTPPIFHARSEMPG